MMEQYRVYEHKTRQDILLLNVQHDLLQELQTRVVAPLVPVKNFGTPISHLNPIFIINNDEYVMDTANMAGFPIARCGENVASLLEHREKVLSAIDFLLCGF